MSKKEYCPFCGKLLRYKKGYAVCEGDTEKDKEKLREHRYEIKLK